MPGPGPGRDACPGCGPAWQDKPARGCGIKQRRIVSISSWNLRAMAPPPSRIMAPSPPCAGQSFVWREKRAGERGSGLAGERSRGEKRAGEKTAEAGESGMQQACSRGYPGLLLSPARLARAVGRPAGTAGAALVRSAYGTPFPAGTAGGRPWRVCWQAPWRFVALVRYIGDYAIFSRGPWRRTADRKPNGRHFYGQPASQLCWL
jgi:hypothetical protein